MLLLRRLEEQSRGFGPWIYISNDQPYIIVTHTSNAPLNSLGALAKSLLILLASWITATKSPTLNPKLIVIWVTGFFYRKNKIKLGRKKPVGRRSEMAESDSAELRWAAAWLNRPKISRQKTPSTAARPLCPCCWAKSNIENGDDGWWGIFELWNEVCRKTSC